MKCPKCGYLGFEQVDRCRNCGYEFTLTPVAVPDLSFLKPTSDGPVALDELGLLSEPSATTPPQASPDLPLFQSSAPVDDPLILKPSPPRQPLAVRRATPDTPRLRSEPRAQTLELAFEPESSPARLPGQAFRAVPSRETHGPRTVLAEAGLLSRLGAVAIDLCILAVVDILVVYFTVKICGISLDDVAVLPKVPLLAFLLAQNGGYLVIFTAGGQTLGKMAAGIKVVTADASRPLNLGQAAMRTLVWLALAVPAGLGFLTAFLTPDRRGLHDRVAGTRVVRASA